MEFSTNHRGIVSQSPYISRFSLSLPYPSLPYLRGFEETMVSVPNNNSQTACTAWRRFGYEDGYRETNVRGGS